uniref:Nuclear fusion protein KAR5 n=1 Tax=Blastobotrys adeninivorans TaxID=409370 RepID=A0A060T8Q7_BLAAD
MEPLVPDIFSALNVPKNDRSCIYSAIGDLLPECAIEGIHADDRSWYGIEIAKCSFRASGVSYPSICDNVKFESMHKCTQELITRPQWWTTYSVSYATVGQLCYEHQLVHKRDAIVGLFDNVTQFEWDNYNRLRRAAEQLDLNQLYFELATQRVMNMSVHITEATNALEAYFNNLLDKIENSIFRNVSDMLNHIDSQIRQTSEASANYSQSAVNDISRALTEMSAGLAMSIHSDYSGLSLVMESLAIDMWEIKQLSQDSTNASLHNWKYISQSHALSQELQQSLSAILHEHEILSEKITNVSLLIPFWIKNLRLLGRLMFIIGPILLLPRQRPALIAGAVLGSMIAIVLWNSAIAPYSFLFMLVIMIPLCVTAGFAALQQHRHRQDRQKRQRKAIVVYKYI